MSISVPAKELDHAIRVQHARTFEINLGGKKETVLIRELQALCLDVELMKTKKKLVEPEAPTTDEGVPVLAEG